MKYEELLKRARYLSSEFSVSSVSLFQNKLNINYELAKRLVEILNEEQKDKLDI